MGADIHFRVEYYAQEETVVQTSEGIKVVSEGEWAWKPAENLTPNEYLARFKEMFDKGELTQKQYEEWSANEPAMTVAYGDRFYNSRNYRLFYKLSGVRGVYNDIEPMSHGNGLPDDLSPEVSEELGLDDLDLHSHTHFTLTELLEEDWEGFDREHHSGFYGTIVKMQVIAIERCGGDGARVRAVFAFDN